MTSPARNPCVRGGLPYIGSNVIPLKIARISGRLPAVACVSTWRAMLSSGNPTEVLPHVLLGRTPVWGRIHIGSQP